MQLKCTCSGHTNVTVDDKRKHVVVECNHFKTDVAAKLQEKQNRINSVN